MTEPKKRLWSPKCRAATFKDKRTKRERTRANKDNKAIKEQSE